MNNLITIRKSIPEDALAVETLRISCWQKDYVGIIAADLLQSLKPELSYKSREQAIISGENNHLVALHGDKIIGLSDSGPKGEKSTHPSEAELYSLYVDAAFRRLGVGKRLFQEQCRLLKERGVTSVCTAVLKGNTQAINFYQKIGGVENGEKVFSCKGKDYPELCFEWML